MVLHSTLALTPLALLSGRSLDQLTDGQKMKLCEFTDSGRTESYHVPITQSHGLAAQEDATNAVNRPQSQLDLTATTHGSRNKQRCLNGSEATSPVSASLDPPVKRVSPKAERSGSHL